MASVVEDRQKAAKILIDLLLKRINALEALKIFPKESSDPSVNVCFHIIVHFDSDEDIRKNDVLYKDTQDDFLVDTAQMLAKGEPLPVNIIQEYKEYYGDDLIYRKITKKNVLKRLLKIINL